MALSELSRWVTADNCSGLLYQGGFLYAALSSPPAVVVKLNPAAMTEIARWTNAGGEADAVRVISDGVFLYASVLGNVGTTGSLVVKIDPATMLEAGRYEDADPVNYTAANALCVDGVNLYLETQTGCRIIEIVRATMMATGSTYVYAGLNSLGFCMVKVGGFLFPNMGGVPAGIEKVNIATLAQAGSYEDLTGINTSSRSLTTDGIDLYLGEYSDAGSFTWGGVVKVDTFTMLETDRWTVPTLDWNVESLVDDNGFIICSAGDGSLPQPSIMKIDPTTMTVVDSWTGVVGEYPQTGNALAADGLGNYYMALNGGIVKVGSSVVLPTVTTGGAVVS
jgi:hypothetical protein